MAKLAYPQAFQKRSFRLSPLELLILGLIILGVLYLVTMWFQSFSAAGQSPGGMAVAPAELDAALAAADRLEGKLNAFDQQLAALGKRIDDWETALKKSPSGQTLPALSERIVNLEKRVANAAPNKGLANRLEKLEKRTSQTELSERRITALDKREQAQQEVVLNRLDKLERDVAEPLKAQTRNETALATLNRRLKNLESLFDKKFMEQQKGQSKVGAYLEVINNRLKHFESTERRQKTQSTQQDVKMDSRLDTMEKRLAKGEQGSQEADKMLAYLAGQVGELKRGIQNMQRRVDKVEQTPPSQTASLQPAPEPAPEPLPQTAQTSQPAESSQSQAVQEPKASAPKPKIRVLRYRVRKGDTLYGIARHYKVKIYQLRDWNPKLKGRKYLYAKETLQIRLPAGR
jgi:LysM repeat protein